MLWHRIISGVVIGALLLNCGIFPVHYASAQESWQLPQPGIRINLSPAFAPPLLKGVKVYPADPFKLDFILDTGDSSLAAEGLQADSTRLIKYFLASITVPEKDLWVNLSPYEQDRIVPDAFGVTEMGRDLLAQDYMLKQITASVIYPEEKIGKEFWDKIYAAAKQRFGTTAVPVDTFNKVWIVPEKAVIYENRDSAYVVEGRLKVLLEEDYLALENGIVSTKIENAKVTNQLEAQIVREVVIPILEQEINEGKNFAQLRQVYNSLILALWFKDKIKENIFGQAYVDQEKVAGVDIQDKAAKDKIWAQYVEAFRKGAYNYIKEDYDPATKRMVPRKYFSGGAGLDKTRGVLVKSHDRAQLPQGSSNKTLILESSLIPWDRAMSSNEAIIDVLSPASRFVSLVGSKAANLSELAAIAGIVIPRGFTVSTNVFSEYQRSIDLGSDLEDLEIASSEWSHQEADSRQQQNIERELQETCERIQAKIINGKMSDHIEKEILSAYERLSEKGEETLTAVRSSATAEDMPGASFAGQYLTLLNQHGNDQILSAIKEVWASLYGFNPVNYRNKKGIRHRKVKMAVLILEMVNPQSAGTAFSVDTETGVPLMSINNSYGLGEAEVSGNVSSDTWIVDPISDIVVKRRKGKKEVRIEYDLNNEANVMVTNQEDLRGEYAISPEIARRIAQKLWAIHQYYTQAKEGVKFVDTEYAVRANGEIVFTQVRPETVFSKGVSLVAVDQSKAQGFPVVYAGGVTGSSGVVSGVIRCVNSVEEALERVRPGDIMVAPNTKSDWEHSMGRAVGMVTEVGGAGNHTAIIAREQKKPAIVGASAAVMNLQRYDGQVVTLDATSKKVYLGQVSESAYYHPDQIKAADKGHPETFEESWQEATKTGQTHVDDHGDRWIGKPNVAVSFFMQDLYARTHQWIARYLNAPVRDRVSGGIYQVNFADIFQWMIKVRGMDVDALSVVLQERLQVVDEYLRKSDALILSPSAIKEWMDVFIRMNAYTGFSYNVYKATESMFEDAIDATGIREPYRSQIRAGMNSLIGETEAAARLKEYKSLLDYVDSQGRGLRINLKAALLHNDFKPVAEQYVEFYHQLISYAVSYRITKSTDIAFPEHPPVGLVVKELLKDSSDQRHIVINELSSEEFFPEDLRFQKIARVALLSEKVRQDAHHIKVRGQWKFTEVIEPLITELIQEGQIQKFEDIFLHDMEWLIGQVASHQNLNKVTVRRMAVQIKPYDISFLEAQTRLADVRGNLQSTVNGLDRNPVKIEEKILSLQHGEKIKAEITKIDLRQAMVDLYADQGVLKRDFTEPFTYDSSDMGLTLNQFVEQKTDKNKRLLVAFNGAQPHWESILLHVIKGNLINKTDQARGLEQKEYAPVSGNFWFLALDSDNRKLHEIVIEDNQMKLPEGMVLKTAIAGVPLIVDGKNVIDEIGFHNDEPVFSGRELRWPRNRSMAISAIGYNGDGELVRIAVFDDITIDQFGELLIKNNLRNAILLGTSADVRTYNNLTGSPFGKIAKPRKQSVTGQRSPGKERPLGTYIAIYAKENNKFSDPGMVSLPGGIDLTRDKMNMQNNGSGSSLRFNFDPSMIKELKNASGFIPVIIDIHPMTTSVSMYLRS